MVLKTTKGPISTGYLEQPRCKECESINLLHDYDTGETVCRDCGFVNDDILIDEGPEWRGFDEEEREKRERTGSPRTETIHDHAMSTMLGYFGEDRDIHRKKFTASQKSGIYRLRKWQNRIRVSDAIEMNLAQALQYITKISKDLNLPKSVIETASVVYKKAVKEGIVRGRSIKGIGASSTYYSIRKAGIPRTVEEVAKKGNLSKKEVAKGYRTLLEELDYRSPAYEPSRFISQYTTKLGLSGKTEDVANKIMNATTEAKLTQGRGPIGIVASATYIASVLTGERKTQKECAKIANVTEVTIRNRYKELVEKLDFITTQ